MVGRGLRPSENKTECLVLDHGGNTLRFGYAEDYDQGVFSLTESKSPSKKAKKCKACGVGVMKYNSTNKKFECQECGHSYDTQKKRTRKFSEECEFDVLDRDVVMVQRLFNLPNYKAKDKLPLSQLRLYQVVRGYKTGWWFKVALDRFDDIESDTPDVWKIVSHRLKMAELEADTYNLYMDLKNQSNGLIKPISGQERKTLFA